VPNATIDPSDTVRRELKTAPPDGFVVLRPLSYGQILERQDKTLRMRMQARRPQDRKRKGNESDLPEVDLLTLTEVGQIHDFSNCIVEHNLTDANGSLLDFSNALTFKVLNPKIAQEIEGYIDELNNPEDSETAEDFIKRATSSPKVDQES
jgi:hypothetical protein